MGFSLFIFGITVSLDLTPLNHSLQVKSIQVISQFLVINIIEEQFMFPSLSPASRQR